MEKQRIEQIRARQKSGDLLAGDIYWLCDRVEADQKRIAELEAHISELENAWDDYRAAAAMDYRADTHTLYERFDDLICGRKE